MSNTATVYVRMDPELKENAEHILARLGISPSSAVQMLYSQIILNQGMPFESKLPVEKPLCIDDLTIEQLSAELMKGVDSMKDGKYYTQEQIEKEFGL